MDNKLDNKKLAKWAFVHSVGVTVYILLVALFMRNADRIFGDLDKSIFGPALFLMLFVLSAAVVGSLIAGKPLMLYLDGKKKEAVTMLGYTILFLFLLFLVGLAKLAIFNSL